MVTKTSDNASNMSEKLQPHQEELHQLAELAGIHMDFKVFRILVELLNMGVDPDVVFNVLKTIRRSTIRSSRSSKSHSHT